MKSTTTERFWKLYDALPEELQRKADEAYELWRLNPQAQGLYFKWYWIGAHDEYIRLLKHL
jgi:hypothetical protein